MSKRDQIRERRKKQRQRQLLITGLAIIGAILMVAAIVIWQNAGPLGDIIIPDPVAHPMADGTRMGDPNAPVLIEEYSDYLCTFCKQFVEETEPELIREYIATGLVYFIFHHFPLGPTSIAPSEASMCAADQGKFWEYHDILFANQAGHDPEAYSDRRLETYAEIIGLNLDQFNTCTSDRVYRDQVQRTQQIGVDLGVNSTPTFFINGKRIDGALPYSVFQQEIEAALVAAGGS